MGIPTENLWEWDGNQIPFPRQPCVIDIPLQSIRNSHQISDLTYFTSKNSVVFLELNLIIQLKQHISIWMR